MSSDVQYWSEQLSALDHPSRAVLTLNTEAYLTAVLCQDPSSAHAADGKTRSEGLLLQHLGGLINNLTVVCGVLQGQSSVHQVSERAGDGGRYSL